MGESCCCRVAPAVFNTPRDKTCHSLFMTSLQPNVPRNSMTFSDTFSCLVQSCYFGCRCRRQAIQDFFQGGLQVKNPPFCQLHGCWQVHFVSWRPWRAPGSPALRTSRCAGCWLQVRLFRFSRTLNCVHRRMESEFTADWRVASFPCLLEWIKICTVAVGRLRGNWRPILSVSLDLDIKVGPLGPIIILTFGFKWPMPPKDFFFLSFYELAHGAQAAMLNNSSIVVSTALLSGPFGSQGRGGFHTQLHMQHEAGLTTRVKEQ